MNREEIEEFINEYVTLAIPHILLDRPFFHSGVITDVGDHYLTLKIKDGYKQICINDVLEIRRLK